MFDIPFRIVLLLYLSLLAFPFRFSPIGTGLDPSWTLAINHFFHCNFVFGRDVFWTYGPLGFLAYPLNIGSNLDMATVFQLFFWSVFIILVFYFSLKSYVTLLQLFIFVVLFAGGQAIYYLGYIGYDYFLSFLVLLFLALSLFQKRWYAFYIIALFLSSLLMFVKFSSAAMALITVIFFVLSLVFVDAKKALTAACFALSIPVLFYVLYMIYYPSFSSLTDYLHGAYELISGNNVAMSLAGSRTELLAALLGFVLYIFLIMLLYRNRENSFILSVMSIGPLFVAFKHGFVRQDTHTIIFFSFVLLVVGLVLFFADIKKFSKPAVCLSAGFFALWLFVCLNHAPARLVFYGVSGIISFGNMTTAANFDKTKKDLDAISRDNLKQAMLTRELMQRIGTRTIGIFPWEISYAAANKLNYVPFPVFQTNNAYTSYLDLLNADSLEDSVKAPALILMEWKAVDGRHPLIDVPAMWLKMYKWYDTYYRENEILLLKRRKVPRFNNLAIIGKRIAGTKSFIELPDMETPLIMKVFLPLNALGKCSKVLFRIDEVRMQLVMESGRTEDYRIVPDTLGDGLFIDFLPVRISDVAALLGDDKIDRVRGFKLLGKGLNMYKKMMTVEFYRIQSPLQL